MGKGQREREREREKEREKFLRRLHAQCGAPEPDVRLDLMTHGS